ncbi:MAG TPA: DoxX family protein [Bacteroidia bacterium]|nr:DoxX family protein [Bacteroidia bacterium]
METSSAQLLPAIPLIQLLSTVFFAILFLQSGLDKVFDWKGNREYHTAQFAGTPLEKPSIFFLFVLAVLEVACGFTCLAGAAALIFRQDKTIAFYGVLLASVIFCCLFAGQRIAKDYAGAVSIVSYFILSLLALFSFEF